MRKAFRQKEKKSKTHTHTRIHTHTPATGMIKKVSGQLMWNLSKANCNHLSERNGGGTRATGPNVAGRTNRTCSPDND